MSDGVKAGSPGRFRIMVHAFDTQVGEKAFRHSFVFSVLTSELIGGTESSLNASSRS